MKKAIEGARLAPAIGPYSAAIAHGPMVFTSGQIALDPLTGELDQGDSIADETRRVLQNLEAVLDAAGCTLEDVVKCSIFLSDMALFPEVNRIYGSFFSEPYPARETVAVRELPRSVNVEISCIAIKKG